MLALQKTDERQRKQEWKDEHETNRQKNTGRVRTLGGRPFVEQHHTRKENVRGSLLDVGANVPGADRCLRLHENPQRVRAQSVVLFRVCTFCWPVEPKL